jgi:hypothetical protein
MRPLVAHCLLGLGKLYRRTDKQEQAQEHLTTATTMCREMGMTYWLEKAAADLQVLARGTRSLTRCGFSRFPFEVSSADTDGGFAPSS